MSVLPNESKGPEEEILFFTDVNQDSQIGDGENKTYKQVIEDCQSVHAIFGNSADKDISNVLIYINNTKNVNNCTVSLVSTQGKRITPTGDADGIPKGCRVLVLMRPPLSATCLDVLQRWSIEKQCSVVRFDFLLQPPFCKEYIEGRIARHCSDWAKPRHQKIQPITGFNVGSLVVDVGDEKNDAFSFCLGKMVDLELKIREISERYKEAMKSIDGNNLFRPERYVQDFKNELKGMNAQSTNRTANRSSYLFTPLGNGLPRVLLTGESGVGKTMLANHLNDLVKNFPSDNEIKLTRISIPSFLGKEEEMELALFGYVPGNHTGALPQGSTGLLVENVGGVMFLDEIGEASPEIQAKLLTYFDDYCVRPRSWPKRESFYCPTLIVAATNRDLTKMVADGTFRHDLLARFTDVIEIPPIRERTECIDFYVDMLLQKKEINPNIVITEVAPDARMKLRYHDYRNGNFRELKEMLTHACRIAKHDGRTFLNAHDIVIW